MIISTKYGYGERVFVVTDDKQKSYIVIKILLESNPNVGPDGFTEVKYGLSRGEYFGWHNECELSSEENYAIKFNKT